MRRLLIVALLGLFSIPSFAAAQDLALKRVMLSSAGLGYFEYEATVESDATLKLTVPLDQVDDVLKSLVVYDDKGGVGGLSLPARSHSSRLSGICRSTRRHSNPRRPLVCAQGRSGLGGGGRAVSGRIVSVQPETTTSKDGTTTTQRTRVTLLTEQGLQQFVLEDAENLQFAEPALRKRWPRHCPPSSPIAPQIRAPWNFNARPGQTSGACGLHRFRAGVESVLSHDATGVMPRRPRPRCRAGPRSRT